MYCQHCGTKLLENARFCAKCGARVEEEFDPTPKEYRDAYSFYNYPYPYNYDYEYAPEPEPGTRIESYLGPNLFLLFRCCLPFGVVGTFHSIQTLRLQRAGFLEAAWFRSRIAQLLFWSGLLLGSIYSIYALWKTGHDPAFLDALQRAMTAGPGTVK